jgi:hypothetical protein
MPVAITISSNAKEVIARLRVMPAAMARRIMAALDDQNERTVAAVIETRMNFSKMGPVITGGLRRQTGMAVKSIRVVPAEMEAGNITSAFGSSLKYVKAHELGFVGTVNVRGHLRRTLETTERKKFVWNKQKQRRDVAWVTSKRDLDRDIYVRPHSMRMNLPARHMFGQTLASRVGAYSVAISDAITQVWEGRGRGTSATSPATRGGLAP